MNELFRLSNCQSGNALTSSLPTQDLRNMIEKFVSIEHGGKLAPRAYSPRQLDLFRDITIRLEPEARPP